MAAGGATRQAKKKKINDIYTKVNIGHGKNGRTVLEASCLTFNLYRCTICPGTALGNLTLCTSCGGCNDEALNLFPGRLLVVLCTCSATTKASHLPSTTSAKLVAGGCKSMSTKTDAMRPGQNWLILDQ
eukprot:scaffold408668_cov18-Prasinocladus_malaysianus.AAC.1